MLKYISFIVIQQVIAFDKHDQSKTSIFCSKSSTNERLELLFNPNECTSFGSQENRDYYINETSRLEILGNGFSNIYSPIRRDALMIQECCKEKFKNCADQMKQLDSTLFDPIATEPIQIDFAKAFYFKDQYISLLIKTTNLPTGFEGTVTVIVDVDRSSCGSSYYSRTDFSVSSPTDRPDYYFSFSDSKMPTNCEAIVYLQIPCLKENTIQCQNLGDESTAFSIIRDSSISSPIAPPSGYKLLGHVINTDRNIEYYINNENDIQLKLLPRDAHTLKIYSSSNGEISCLARGFPPPSIKLTNSATRSSGKCEGCGWDCTKCSWQLPLEPSFCDSRTADLYCRARTTTSSKYSKSLPLQQPEYGSIEPLVPQSTVSIFGAVGGGFAEIEFRIPLMDWSIKRSCYDSKNPKQDKKLQRLLSSLLEKVSWFHGSKPFGCGRKYQNIKLADSCAESDSCDVIVGLYIFNPTLEDAGYYKMSIAELGLESSLHKLEVDNGETEFIKSVNSTDTDTFARIPSSESTFYLETKFKIHSCIAFDGRNVRCLWWPMFRQIRRTLRTFSIQYFRTDVCSKIANLESRKNDFERVTTFIPTNYNSVNDAPGQMEYVATGLVPGAKYEIMICGWDCASESECWKRNEDEALRITGFGQRFCKSVEIEMPLEPPIHFASDTSTLKYSPMIGQSAEPMSARYHLSSVVSDALYPSIDGFEAIIAVNNSRFIADKSTESIKFIAHSVGNHAEISSLPPSSNFIVNYRFYNAYGFGPIKYEYNDKTVTRSHPRPKSLMSTGSPAYVNENFDQLEDADFYLSDLLCDESSVTFQVVKFMSPDTISNNINLEILNAKVYKTGSGTGSPLEIQKNGNRLMIYHNFYSTNQNKDSKIEIYLSRYLIGTIIGSVNTKNDEKSLPPPAIISAHRSFKGLLVQVIPRLFLLDQSTGQSDAFKMSTMVRVDRYPLVYTLEKLRIESSVEKVQSTVFYFDFEADCESRPQYCDKEVRLVFYTAVWNSADWTNDQVSETSPTLFFTNQNIMSFGSKIIQNNMVAPEFQLSTLTTTKYQRRLAIANVIEPKHATGYAYAIEFQFVDQFKYQKQCSEMTQFETIHNGPTLEFMLPRQHYEATVDTGNDSEGYNIDFVKMISFCETTQEYDQVCDIENRIRIGGGMDGLNITATDLIKIRDANHHPMLDNGLFEPPLDTCSMCVRARLVYRQAVGTGQTDNDDSCISTSSGCKGVWSKGQHYEHRLQRNCDRSPQDRVPPELFNLIQDIKRNNTAQNLEQIESVTSEFPSTEKVTSGPGFWPDGSSRIVTCILVIIIFCILLLAIFCCYNKQCFDKWTNSRSDYLRQDFVGLEKACSRSETNLSQKSFEYSEVTMNCHQPMSLLLENGQRLPPTHQINAYTMSRDGDGALLMSQEDNRNDETDSGCSSMPGENSLLR